MPRGYRADFVKSKPQVSAPLAAPPSSVNSFGFARRAADFGGLLSRSSTGSSSKLDIASTPVPHSEHQEISQSRTPEASRPGTPSINIDSTYVNSKTASNPSRPVTPNEAANTLRNSLDACVRPSPLRNPSDVLVEEEEARGVLDSMAELSMEGTQSSRPSSQYSGDSLSIYSSQDSASLYSSASSIYSSGASTYSFDDCDGDRTIRSFQPLIVEEDEEVDESQPIALAQQRRRASTISVKPLDAAARENSTLVKKAAWFRNSRMQPELPRYETTLPMWSLICRASVAARQCYGSRDATHRQGQYTPSNTKENIKAMLIDDQNIDSERVLIVAIRGTKFQSMSDWTVNGKAVPVKPTGFLDDEDNDCHAGFLAVTKAMMAQVASQLAAHPASAEMPTLLFTGHSAGGAVAALLYSHMLSTTITSELTELVERFPVVHCITFGAPPLSLTPLPQRDNGVYLSFANEGDPVLRLSDAAYVKSLAKLMTASQPAALATVVAPVKVVRRSRGNGVIRQTPVAPVVPWEELPLWPTPPIPLTNGGNVVLLRDVADGVAASRVSKEQLESAIFGDLAQHTMEMYLRRIKDVTLAAMMGT